MPEAAGANLGFDGAAVGSTSGISNSSTTGTGSPVRTWGWGRVEISAFAQSHAFERMAVGGEEAFGERLLFDEGAHAFHLGIEVVEVMEKESLGEDGYLGRAEFQMAVMAEDHVLDEVPQLDGELRQSLQLLRQHTDGDGDVAEQLTFGRCS